MGKGIHIVIVGGGTAGISVASSLVRQSNESEVIITIIEPSDKHYYQIMHRKCCQ